MAQKNYKNFINKSNIQINITQFKNFNNKLNKYNSKIILSDKIINCLMLCGEKNLAEKIFYKTFKLLQKVSLKNSKIVLKFSLLNVSPIISVFKKKNKKRIVREIPFLLKPTLRIILAIKNIINMVKKQSYNIFSEHFKNDIIFILKKNSEILIKKNELHTYALKNKAFAHFRWF
jgi:small subunit ribosomal protein S7